MAIEDPQVPQVSNVGQPVQGSLEARIAARRQVLEQRTTDKFDVPGFEGIFQVELSLVGGKRQHGIVTKYERLGDYEQAVNAAADLIIAATVAFYDGEGNPAEDMSWQKAAAAIDPHMTAEVPARVQLVRVLGETGVLELTGAWRRWTQTRGQRVEHELEQDF